MATDDFMQQLPVTTFLHTGHQDRLCGEVGEIIGHGAANDTDIDDQPAGEVRGKAEHGIGGEEGLRDDEAANRTIVEGSFEPLCRGCLSRQWGESVEKPT